MSLAPIDLYWIDPSKKNTMSYTSNTNAQEFLINSIHLSNPRHNFTHNELISYLMSLKDKQPFDILSACLKYKPATMSQCIFKTLKNDIFKSFSEICSLIIEFTKNITEKNHLKCNT